MLRFLAIIAALLGGAVAAAAQSDYPNRPVTIIVPFPPGGSADVVSRVLADEFAKLWKQQVVVENKAGGATVVGNTAAARAKPDGYTILMISSGFVIIPAVQSSLPYDPIKDFIPVGLFIDSPSAIVAGPSLPQNTMVEVIEEAKRRTDKPISYSTPGAASSSRMVAELLQRKAGITLKRISYQGEALALPDLLAGRVDMQLGTWSVQRPYVEEGKLKLLAMLYRTRLPEAPNTPTLTEIIPDFGVSLGSFNGIAVPAGTPSQIVDKISADLKTVVESESFKSKILPQGSYPRYTTVEETGRTIRGDIARWSEIAKAANIKTD